MSLSSRLGHEQLDVYKAAIEFLALASEIIETLPRGHGVLVDQLRRAALSIPLNIAEGYGKRSSLERRRFYEISRGSAHECGAILDALLVVGLISEPTAVKGKTLIYRVVAMLVRLIAA